MYSRDSRYREVQLTVGPGGEQRGSVALWYCLIVVTGGVGGNRIMEISVKLS